jgi:hypothetical protein
MLAQSGMTLLLLGTGAFVRWSESTRTILNYADNVVCALFLIDLLYHFEASARQEALLLDVGRDRSALEHPG